jgi:Rps23 Pro-64 3,4-dihydroxylase Tpa1-like proline 4-hydroxylase
VPFEHVVIPDFFDKEYSEKVYDSFPKVDSTWFHYNNPIEKKYTFSKFSELTFFKELFDYLQSDYVLNILRNATGIENLEADPYLHGAGIHAYPRGGKLDCHLDYSIHPISGKERRLNLIIYLNKNWEDEYGGHLKLWDSTRSNETCISTSVFNTAILFRTSDESYHGVPELIKCPEGQYRKSINVYYVTPPREGATRRLKAEFFPAPGQPVDSRLSSLYTIRKNRLLTPKDLWPGWETDGDGYW